MGRCSLRFPVRGVSWLGRRLPVPTDGHSGPRAQAAVSRLVPPHCCLTSLLDEERSLHKPEGDAMGSAAEILFAPPNRLPAGTPSRDQVSRKAAV